MTTTCNPPGETDSEATRALQIIESMPGHAWSADAAGRFTYVSPNALAFLGSAREELDASVEEDKFGWRQVVHPDDYDHVAARWRHCLQTGDHYNTEHRLRGADGVYRWFRNSGRASRDSQGRITQWYGTTIDIDDQKRAEAALRDRERELSQLVDMVPSHLWRLTPDGEPIFFNKRMVDFLGLDVADTDKPGMSRLAAMIEASIHPDDAPAFGNELRRCLATGERFSMRYRLRRVDGVYRWMSSRAEPLRDQEGRIVQWYGLCHDIDDQMHAEEALRRSERQLQQLIDTVPAMIWSMTPDGTPAYVNERFSDVTGATLDDITAPDGSASLSVIHPDDAAAARQALGRSLATGVPYVQRYRQLRADGGYHWTETRAEPLRDEDGAVLRWYGVSADIHDLVTAQEALRESERSLRQLVETLPALIYCAAPDGKPIYRSQTLRKFLGFDLEDKDEAGRPRLAGTLDAIIHPDDLAVVKERYGHSLATGAPYAQKHRLRRFDGEYRWVETRTAAMRNAEGAIVQWNGVCLDIEDQVRAQEALRLAQENLARASQAASLAELSASIAHEVNQPLAAVVANSHACQRWLEAEPPNIERARITVGRITRDANAAADVVSRVRSLFKQSAGPRPGASLGDAIAEARDLMAEEAARRSVRMDVDVERDLPPVAFDRVQIQQVLINLVRNGMEAMDSVASDRVLRMRVRRMADAVQAEISDRGRGIEFPDKIFAPFFTTKEHGMGMGLAICQSIVESHGGRLWAEKGEPQGATFIFTLPVEAKTAP